MLRRERDTEKVANDAFPYLDLDSESRLTPVIYYDDRITTVSSLLLCLTTATRPNYGIFLPLRCRCLIIYSTVATHRSLLLLLDVCFLSTRTNPDHLHQYLSYLPVQEKRERERRKPETTHV
jgi:hypothetical protein